MDASTSRGGAEGMVGDEATASKRFLCELASSGPPSSKREPTQTRRQCSSCGKTETSQWHGGKSGPIKCASCYAKAHYEAMKAANPGLKCSSCGETKTSHWYGVKSGPIKCASCYSKAHYKAKVANPGFKCSTCGETETSQWYGRRSSPEGSPIPPYNCHSCYKQACLEVAKAAHPVMQCSSCGQTESSQWYGLKTGPIKCSACYDLARLEAAGSAHFLFIPVLKCESCGKTDASQWHRSKSGQLHCKACHDTAGLDKAGATHPDFKCSSCGNTKTCKWYGIKSGPKRECQTCHYKAAHPDLKCSFCGRTESYSWCGIRSGPIRCNTCQQRVYSRAKAKRQRNENEEAHAVADPAVAGASKLSADRSKRHAPIIPSNQKRVLIWGPPEPDPDSELPVWLQEYTGELLYLPGVRGMVAPAPLECSVCRRRYKCMPFDESTNKFTCEPCTDRIEFTS